MPKKLPKTKECGPWFVKTWKFTVHHGERQGEKYKDVVVASDDFDHDVHLEIRGDFKNMKEKMKYAKMLARRLNKATKLEKGII